MSLDCMLLLMFGLINAPIRFSDGVGLPAISFSPETLPGLWTANVENNNYHDDICTRKRRRLHAPGARKIS
jgi:hypothetical protein